jgi:DNA ligase-1
MLYKTFCTHLSKMEETTKRLEIMALFQEIFRDPAELVEGDEYIHDKIIYLCQGRLYPEWTDAPELNVAKETAKKAFAASTGLTPAKINATLQKAGDLGVAFQTLAGKKGAQTTLIAFNREPLTVMDVYSILVQIANLHGKESQDKKIKLLAGMFSRCDPVELKFLGRFIDGKLRLGTADLTMMEAVARMLATDEAEQKPNREIIERAYNIYPDLGLVIKTAFLEGIDALRQFSPRIGVPIRSMLAQRLEGPDAFIEKHGGPFAAEYKLDGERIQIHKDGDAITLFSRRQSITTSQFPDVVESVKRYILLDQAILDGEVVAINPDTGKLGKFQVLMQRKRVHGVDQKAEEVPTRVYLFDILFADGASMLEVPYLDRRAKLEAAIGGLPDQQEIVPVPQTIVHDTDELVAYFNQAIADGTEGVLTKSISEDSVYQPGARGWLWIKLKSLVRGKLTDSMDMVVVGVNWGEGRRSGRYGTLLVAARDEETDTLQVMTKVASGMTDELADMFFNKLKVLPDQPRNVLSGEVPDKWVEPEIVLEIVGDDITRSSQTQTGVSIRFPRIVHVREDKAVDDATTVGEIIDMMGT